MHMRAGTRISLSGLILLVPECTQMMAFPLNLTWFWGGTIFTEGAHYGSVGIHGTGNSELAHGKGSLAELFM